MGVMIYPFILANQQTIIKPLQLGQISYKITNPKTLSDVGFYTIKIMDNTKKTILKNLTKVDK
jgi:hypothetical protein